MADSMNGTTNGSGSYLTIGFIERKISYPGKHAHK